MNAKQEQLLQLLKEIDSFCKTYNITYYCAAGTVLGAIRHGGFIPWDDDIDILMTRDEFLRFVSAFKRNGPKDRTLEYYEADPDHHSTVARYIKEDSTMFCHYHILGYASAGILIDIFILDPVSDDLEEQRSHIAKFYAYSDLIAPTLCHSNRLPEKYEHIYEETLSAVAHYGLDAVTTAFADELFSMDSESCSTYMLRWGSQPFIYPKTFFEEPVFLAFEDMMIPVPSKWPQYLVTHYSFGWTEIPQIDGQDHHVTIFSPDRDYHEVYKRRDSLYAQSDLIQLHRDLQEARRKADHISHILEDYAGEFHSGKCISEVKKRCHDACLGYSGSSQSILASVSKQLFSEGQYSTIVSIFEPYIKLQTSSKYMGGHMHGRYYRWLFPLIIQVEEDVFHRVLYSLLYTGRLIDCDKLCGIYMRAGLDTAETHIIRSYLENISIASGLYYSGDFVDAISYIRSIDGYEDIQALKNYEWLSLVAAGLNVSQASSLEIKASEKNASPEIRKAWADHLYKCGSIQKAGVAYNALMQTSRNGMFLKDIQAKGFDVDLKASEATSNNTILDDTTTAKAHGFLNRANRALARRLPGLKKRAMVNKCFKAIMGNDEDISQHKNLPWEEYAEAHNKVSILDRRARDVWQNLLEMAQ